MIQQLNRLESASQTVPSNSCRTVVVVLEHRFDRTPDGAIWTQTMFAYPFWTRYLAVFESVRVVARVRTVNTVPPDWKRADGANVTFAAVPYYVGLWEYLQRSHSITQAIRAAVQPSDAVILRVGSAIASHLIPVLRQSGKPYAIEVVGDPYDVFAPGAIKHPLRALFRWWFPRQLRDQCATASAASYVTHAALQARYPATRATVSTAYSDVELSRDAFAIAPRHYPNQRTITLITVGTLAQLYKAPHVLIEAVSHCIGQGLDLNLILVGDGKHRIELEAQVEQLGLSDRIHFKGQLSSGAAVRELLEQADVFVLASYQEGLPRALIEAMAQGLPCIGSTVGGIPELLDAEDLVPPGNAIALCQKIQEVVSNPDRMQRMSERNWQTAHRYTDEILSEHRSTFYHQVQQQTEAWINPTLLHITTVPDSFNFFTGQLRYMEQQGFNVHLLASPGEVPATIEPVPTHAIEMPRRITPLADLIAIYKIWRLLRELRPQIVHAHTPKGGLLGTIAAWLAGVPVRIYQIHGLPLMTATGLKHQLLRWSETVACLLANRVLCVSHSIQAVSIALKLCSSQKSKVLWNGSVNGIDAIEKFNPTRIPASKRQAIRQQFAIPDNDFVLGYAGRIVNDKGITELVLAWQKLRERFEHLHLLMVGAFEPQDAIAPEIEAILRQDPRIHLAGETWEIAPFYAVMDLLVLPSYREGLGTVLLEAAAMELPTVASRIPGCIDAVQDGITGTFVERSSVVELTRAISAYIVNPALCYQHGQAGRNRILDQFNQASIWDALYQEYTLLLQQYDA
jgi:glycosyltransferase involved in cell wall biosynthesis